MQQFFLVPFRLFLQFQFFFHFFSANHFVELRRFLFICLRFLPGFLCLTSKLVSELDAILMLGNPSLGLSNKAVNLPTTWTGHRIRQLIQEDLVEPQLLIGGILSWVLHGLKSVDHSSMLDLELLLKDPIFAELYPAQHGWRLSGAWSHLVPACVNAIFGHLTICERSEDAATHGVASVHASAVAVSAVHRGVLSARHAVSGRLNILFE
jgi:hypothetical protein